MGNLLPEFSVMVKLLYPLPEDDIKNHVWLTTQAIYLKYESFIAGLNFVAFHYWRNSTAVKALPYLHHPPCMFFFLFQISAQKTHKVVIFTSGADFFFKQFISWLYFISSVQCLDLIKLLDLNFIRIAYIVINCIRLYIVYVWRRRDYSILIFYCIWMVL